MTESFANSVRECVGNKVLSFIGASSLEGKLATTIKIKGISFTSITKTSEMNMLVLGQAHSLPRNSSYRCSHQKCTHTHTHTHTHMVSVAIILYQQDTGNNINAHQLDLIQCIELHTFRETLSIEKNKSLYTLIELLPLYIDRTNHCDFFFKLSGGSCRQLYHIHPLPCDWSQRAPQSPPDRLATPSHAPAALDPGSGCSSPLPSGQPHLQAYDPLSVLV